MAKHFLFIFFLLFVIHFANGGTILEGTIKNVPANKIYLTNRGPATGPSFELIILDSCITDSAGSFHFTIKNVDESKYYSLEFNSIKLGWIPLLIRNNEHIIISAEIITTRKIYSITGSSEYDLKNIHNKILNTYIVKLNNYADSSEMFRETDSAKAKFYTKQNKLYSDSIKFMDLKFVQKHPKSTAALHIIDDYKFSISNDSLKNMLAGMDYSLKNLTLYQTITEFTKSTSKIKPGSYTPILFLKDSGNRLTKINLKRSNETLTVIDFWASWCAPCRENFGELKSFFEKLDKTKYRFLSISIDENIQKWKNALLWESIPWENYIINPAYSNKMMASFSIQSIPKYIIVNEEGKVVLITNSIIELKKKLN